MKRCFKICVAIVVLIFGIIILPSCKPRIESGYVKTGTLQTTIARGEVLFLDDVIVRYTYSDKSTIDVTADHLTFGYFDSNSVGTNKLTITYDNFTFDVDIKIVTTEADISSITTLSSRLVDDYNERRGRQENANEEFVNGGEPIYVGDDNKFDFRIFATGIDGSGNLQTDITKVRTDIVVKLKGDNGSQIIPSDMLDYYVSIDTENTILDFTENAIGKDFEVEVSAVNTNDLYANSQTSFTAPIRVVDGYNVYNARDLSVYDNTHSLFDNIRPINEKINAIILQDDIVITKDDVRSDIFWTADHPNYSIVKNYTDREVIGTPIDYSGTGIYHRKLLSGEQFAMYGNYFKIDVSKFPKMVVESDDGGSGKNGVNVKESGYMTSHLSLFYNENISDVTEQNKESLLPSTVIHENIYFFGNGALNNQPENSGALTACKVEKTNYIAKNNITHNFYIANFFVQSEDYGEREGYNVIDGCKAYNSYQTLVYSWGCKNLKMINCDYKYAGGPAMIVDHVKPDKEGGGYPSFVDCINCEIASIVSGREPWFVTYGASDLVMQLMTADQLFTGVVPSGDEFVPNGLPQNGKTMITKNIVDGKNVNSINLIVAMKSGNAQGLTVEKINGYVRMFDNVDDYNSYYGINGTDKNITTYGLDMTTSESSDSLAGKAFGSSGDNSNILYFESSKSGGYINPNVAENKDASFVKPVTLFTILSTILNTNSSTGVQDNDAISQAVATFQMKDIESMKDILKKDLLALKNNGAISLVYDNAVKYQLIDGGDNIDDEKYNSLLTIVDSFVSCADGRYVNIYLFNGMGAMIELFDKD